MFDFFCTSISASPSDDLDNLSSSHCGVRFEKVKLKLKRPQGQTGPSDCGQYHCKVVRGMLSENMKGYCFPNDMIPDMTGTIRS